MLGDERLLNEHNIAIIGSRNCTKYGKKQAERFAKNLSIGGFNVISGMARGIDSISHNACIEANGKTIAVLGSGFNYIYPEENIYLFNKILQTGGAVITEYSPNEKVVNTNFPARNRIISGLSLAVLVIEAAYRSGTSITAGYAKSQGRDVYCIPSSINSNKGVGTAKLIEKGAKIVLKPEDILKNYNIDESSKNIKNKIPSRKMPPMYTKTYECIGKNGSHINEIAKKTEKSIQIVSQELFMLELEGYVEKIPGGYYVPKT